LRKTSEVKLRGDDSGSLCGGGGLDSFELILPNKTLSETIKSTPSGDGYRWGERLIGTGVDANIYEGEQCSTGKVVAIKAFPKSKDKKVEDIYREAEMLELCKHERVIPYLDFFEDPDTYVLVTEHAEGGDLLNRLKDYRYSESQAKALFCQLVSAVQHINSLSVVHRDIKPENVLLVSLGDASQVKLNDFGCAVMIPEGERCTGMVGTLQYMAPEMISALPYG
jgi:serine/threonine protein kinase